mmetsp:Transcript_57303/g.124544  ORF Transcript_57303/g.124544 Transcript_57303/m.124544 type:complete len:122 (+) Transcript_57303:1165-1530(+)
MTVPATTMIHDKLQTTLSVTMKPNSSPFRRKYTAQCWLILIHESSSSIFNHGEDNGMHKLAIKAEKFSIRVVLLPRFVDFGFGTFVVPIKVQVTVPTRSQSPRYHCPQNTRTRCGFRDVSM